MFFRHHDEFKFTSKQLRSPPMKRRKFNLNKKRITAPAKPAKQDLDMNRSRNKHGKANALTEKQKINLVCFGFIRVSNRNIPTTIKCLCANFYGFPISMKTKILNDVQKRALLDSLNHNFRMPITFVSSAHIFRNQSLNLKLVYRASRDGFCSDSFHRLCNGCPNTLTIIKTNFNSIFGAYTNKPWTSNDCFVADSNAFLFTLPNRVSGMSEFKKLAKKCKPNLECNLYPIKPEQSMFAVYHGSNYGPCFGKKFDIFLSGNTKLANIFQSYCAKSCSSFSVSDSKILCGSDQRFHSQSNALLNLLQPRKNYNFTTIDYEVFTLTNIPKSSLFSDQSDDNTDIGEIIFPPIF